jgi:hypothetical protein
MARSPKRFSPIKGSLFAHVTILTQRLASTAWISPNKWLAQGYNGLSQLMARSHSMVHSLGRARAPMIWHSHILRLTLPLMYLSTVWFAHWICNYRDKRLALIIWNSHPVGLAQLAMVLTWKMARFHALVLSRHQARFHCLVLSRHQARSFVLLLSEY